MSYTRTTTTKIVIIVSCLFIILAASWNTAAFTVAKATMLSALSGDSKETMLAGIQQPATLGEESLKKSYSVRASNKAGAQPGHLLYMHVPVLTYGLQKNLPGLPNGDLFSLNHELHYEDSDAPDGVTFGFMNSGNFGDSPLPYSVNSVILLNPVPYSLLRITSFAENFRLVHFSLASLSQAGGRVTFYLVDIGAVEIPLAEFRVDGDGAILVSKHQDISIYENDLLGDKTNPKNVSDLMKLTASAGTAGSRTGLLTMKFSGSLRRCLQLRMDLARNGSNGQLSVELLDHVVGRVPQTGDELLQGKGLINNTSGGYPTKFECYSDRVSGDDTQGGSQDTTGPVFSGVPSDISQTITSGNSAIVNFSIPTAIDAVDGVRTVATTRSDGQSGNVFPVGQTTVTFAASDTHGNASTASFKVTIINASQQPGPDPNFNIQSFAGNGTYGTASNSGLAATATFKEPRGVAVDAAGNVYVSDAESRVVRRVNGTAVFAFAGTGLKGSSGDGGLATAASFNNPTGLAVDSSGNLYIADTNNHRIRKVVGSIITTIAGNGIAGFAGDGGDATNAKLNYPTAVAVDAAGNVYIADTGNNRIRKITGTTISTVAGNGVAGFGGDGGLATSAILNAPSGIAVSADGNTLYIADTGSNRVRKVIAGTISTLAGNGTAGFGGDGGAADQASLHAPIGLALDGNGNLLIADSDNERIRRLKLGDQTIITIAGNGTAGNGGDGFGATGALLDTPTALAIHLATGNLYVADTGNLRIRQLTPTASNNSAPIVAAIPASSVNAGQVLDINLSATDAEGDPVTFLLPQATPAFISITNANPQARTATLHIIPSCANLGVHNITVQASDGKATATLPSFALTVADSFNACGSSLAISSITPNSGKRGQTVSMTINGSGFAAGADVNFAGGGIAVSNVNVSSTQITLTVKVSATATVSKRTITVANPSSQSYSLPQAFQVNP